MKQAIIIGAGIAGLAAAIRLRSKGYKIDVYEANAYPGGKLHAFTQDGYRFDAGPSLFTMPWLVDELFELYDLNPADHFNYLRKPNICNYFWVDGSTLNVPADINEFSDRAAAVFQVEAYQIKDYLKASERKYRLTAPLFLERSLHKLSTYLRTDTIKALFAAGNMGLFSSLDEVNQKVLNEPHLVQLFNRYATYNGSSPYLTPGIMSMIPFLEMGQGTFYPRGGMHAITRSLYKLARERGVSFHFNHPVQRICVEDAKAKGVTVNGNFCPADVVVSNMDIYPTYKRLMPDQKQPQRVLQQERSSSALIFYWGINRNFEELDLHNIFFSANYEAEFEHIFKHKTLFEDPTVYINITSKEDAEDAPPGCENWFVMINVPGDYGQPWDDWIPRARRLVTQKLSRMLGTPIEPLIATSAVLDPRKIEIETSSFRGALYGAASNDRMAAFLRHPNFSRQIRNLFFCGGSVHPGGGIPLCLLSAKIVDDLVPKA